MSVKEKAADLSKTRLTFSLLIINLTKTKETNYYRLL